MIVLFSSPVFSNIKLLSRIALSIGSSVAAGHYRSKMRFHNECVLESISDETRYKITSHEGRKYHSGREEINRLKYYACAILALSSGVIALNTKVRV